MLPLWRNRLYVYLSPGHISLLKLGRGLRPKLLGEREETVDASGAQQPWQAAVARLAELLTEPEWQVAEVDVTLSNRFMQYAAISFDRQLKKYAEQEAYARHVLVQRHGPVAGHWDLRIQKGTQGMAWLVSGVDRALLEACRQLCADRKARLRSLSPYLMTVFNRVRGSLERDPAWLVVGEPGYTLIMLFKDQAFCCIHGVADTGADELPMLLDRENLIAGLAEPCKTAYVFAPFEAGRMMMASNRGYDFIHLEGWLGQDVSGSGSGIPAGILGGVV